MSVLFPVTVFGFRKVMPKKNEKPRNSSISQARLDQNKVRKRRQTVFRKLDELQKYGVDIYVVINQNNRYYTYTSKKTESWPPSPGKIVRVVLNMPREVERSRQLADWAAKYYNYQGSFCLVLGFHEAFSGLDQTMQSPE
ncbi:hypothetical protein MGG_16004 [Pyricularia oryzae 70-15]|uniref:MADS-box domain-containing protein n=3 Tax=Pyricularia oryzae TaxID=318829 RepID=G4MMT2_PYRO7|nr:uncharacterized protein MGG_16004 [Pyricularia oryzae 70-15]EHA56162.1 hypothetical protein MGG_16004 [Pyricularia oryzae 70-15]ELQ35958.1 hypothetical protein OOU_Y34scaffold00676g3 [Pyricularia oryzae Y34]